MSASFERQLLDVVPRLRSYARSLSYNKEDADDLLQDCLERAFARREGWNGRNIKAWTMTIMTNLFKNQLRHKGSLPTHIEFDEMQSGAQAVPDVDLYEQDQLKKALNALNADQRVVLMLVTLHGHSYEEVADILEIPVGTVMSRLSRARTNLSALLSGTNVVSFRRPS